MDTVDPARFVFAFLFVLGLIGLMAMGLKRYAAGRLIMGAKEGGGSRLGVVEVRWLDAKRRLVLVRRDGCEHLLLLADGRETVIESVMAGE